MKRLILIIIVWLMLSFTKGYVEEFEIEVDPSPVKVNEPADLTIRALDDLGEVVEDFEWDVFMMIEWEMEEVIDEFPGDGEYDWFYTFDVEDQWEITFSNWLIFRETSDIMDEGHFTFVAELLEDPSIRWEYEIEVISEDSEEEFEVSLSSPTEGAEIEEDELDVIWTSDAPNSFFEVILNGDVVREDLTDDNWDINVSVEDIEEWENTLEIKIYDIDQNVIAESGEVEFEYVQEDVEYLESVEIQEDQYYENEDFLVIANTWDRIEGVDIIIEDYEEFSMEEMEPGRYEADVAIEEEWVYDLSFELFHEWEADMFENQASVEIVEWININNVKYQLEMDENQIPIEWDYGGEPSQFKVVFAEEEDNIDDEEQRGETIVDDPEIVLEEIDTEQDYYIQISALDEEQNKVGASSDVVFIEWWHPAPNGDEEPSCEVAGIQLSTMKEWDSYYLTWEEVDWVDNYNIYMSDSSSVDSVDDMQKVGETEDTRFEYPFDPEADQVEHEWYTVIWECEDWSNVQVWDMRQVQVGPFMNFLIFVFLAAFVYFSYRLYNFSK